MCRITDEISEIDSDWRKAAGGGEVSIGKLNGCKREIAVLEYNSTGSSEIYRPVGHSCSLENRAISDNTKEGTRYKISPLMSRCSRVELDAYYQDKEGNRAGVKAVFENDDKKNDAPKNDKPSNDKPSNDHKTAEKK